MAYDRAYFRMVGLALLPALGVSVVIVLVGQFLLNMRESTVDRVAQIVFFPIFLAACHYFRSRLRNSHSRASRTGVD